MSTLTYDQVNVAVTQAARALGNYAACAGGPEAIAILASTILRINHLNKGKWDGSDDI